LGLLRTIDGSLKLISWSSSKPPPSDPRLSEPEYSSSSSSISSSGGLIGFGSTVGTAPEIFLFSWQNI
jgi:hypothetical protein